MVYFDILSHREGKIRIVIYAENARMVWELPLKDWQDFFKANGVQYSDFTQVSQFLHKVLTSAS